MFDLIIIKIWRFDHLFKQLIISVFRMCILCVNNDFTEGSLNKIVKFKNMNDVCLL